MIKKILLLTLFYLIAFPVLAQDDCPSSQILRFADGKTDCMKNYKFFNLPFPSEKGASLKEVVAGKERMSIAMVKNPKACPLNWMEFRVAPLKTWPDHGEASSLARCEDRVISAVLKQNKNPVGCDCEIIYNLEARTNVPLSKNVFEKKIRGWVAQAQNQDRFKGQFTEDEKKENTLFLAQYLENTGSTLLNTPVTQSNSLETNKLADEKKLQQELAKKQQLDLEQKQLAEKVRLEQDAVKKAQLENDQKDLAEKARQEKERIAIEASRIQSELARLKILEKEQRPIANTQTTKSVKALVIGNSSYGVSALINPMNDAQAIAKRLTEFGFKVDLVLDGNRKALIAALTKFQSDSSKYEINILFYAGHGIQLNGINYIIPVDMSLAPNGSNVEFDAIPVNSVVEKYMQASTKLVFLDACRDNPLSRSLQVVSRGSGGSSRGLAPMDVGGGTLISYSTKDGSVALDGDGKNSPYTEAMLAHMNERIDISLLLRKVRKTVMTKTNGKQVPWDYGSLMSDELVLSNK